MARHGKKKRASPMKRNKFRAGANDTGGAEDAAVYQEGQPAVSVIIPVLNEKRTLPQVIRQARKVHPRTEVIVVANGTRDGSDLIASRMGAKVLYYPEPLGHDVGRSIGAKHARGDILLFLDGDFVVGVEDLKPFVRAVASGLDVALNEYSGPTGSARVHSVVLAKHALNHILGRPDLKGFSMTAVPHAVSRRALNMIGADCLAVPPSAHAAAIASGLFVAGVHSIHVGRKNPLRRKFKAADPLASLIFGDHLEAVGQWLENRDFRGDFGDMGRDRNLAEELPCQ